MPTGISALAFRTADYTLNGSRLCRAPGLLDRESQLRWIRKLPRIARHAGMSTRTLSRRFLERVGTTPAQWVSAARVRRPQQLLETTGLSVEEVAAQSGFRSASVLRQHFGEMIGTTPLAYRRNFASDRGA